ncbi:hypothetical protein GLOIN_2v1548720, partial [Rhizophagus irregularis DAOM 181602=DAOM 197198]
ILINYWRWNYYWFIGRTFISRYLINLLIIIDILFTILNIPNDRKLFFFLAVIIIIIIFINSFLFILIPFIYQETSN